MSPSACPPFRRPRCTATPDRSSLPAALEKSEEKGQNGASVSREAHMTKYAWLVVFCLGCSTGAFAQERMPPIPADKMTDAQ